MKRFLQGLGIGIFAATMIFTVSYYAFGNKKMSDSEIINRATKLGMIQPTEAPIISESSGESVDIQNNADAENAGDLSEGQAGDIENTVSQDIAVTEPLTEPITEPETDGTIQLTINKGDGATVVSLRLQQLGIITDAIDFDNYLRNISRTHSLQVGTFDLRVGMSYEEIAAIISSGV